MKCPGCQAENPGGQRFCGQCGGRLASLCAACGAATSPGQKFCGACGVPLTGAVGTARFGSPESYTPQRLAEKILTSKAALGAPLAHEDHAVRACYAALRMQESVKQYAEEVRRSHAAVVKIRVGLNSGEVVVRAIGSDLHMDYTAVGQTTHLAARMEQLADPGAIVITPDTLALAEGYVEVKSLGPVPVKGLADPVEVYEVTGAGPARTRLQASTRRWLTRFVGRDAEVEQLRRAQQLAGDGHGQVAAIVGEAGVGKSRLVYELSHSQ